MRVGVISDTHVKRYDNGLKLVIDKHFHACDLIIHAGDLVDISVLDMFAGREVKAVWGNMDPPSVRQALPEIMTFPLGPFWVGLVHGWGSPVGLVDKLLKLFGSIDCLIYGHTHVPANQVREDVLFFNPGSATHNRFALHNSLGILEISERIKGEIITLA